MKAAATQSLYAYWNGLRGARPAPKRFEIEPSCIATHLPDTFILERVDQETARFRLAGTRLCEAFGMDFRGTNILALFDKADQRIILRDIDTIATHCSVGLYLVEARDAASRAATFEMLILPLRHTRDVVDRFIGSMVPVSRPDWLGSEPLTTRRLLRHELISPDGRSRAPAGTAQKQVPMFSQMSEARIVRSDRRQFRVYEGGLRNGSDE